MTGGLPQDERLYRQWDERAPQGLGGLWYGVAPATVADNQDPDGQGRVKVLLPWTPDASSTRYEAWARLATMFAGPSCGSWFVPHVGDEVLVAFEHGDPRRPYVLGMLWNGSDAPPESMDLQNTNKTLKSRNGVTVRLVDRQGQEELQLETPGGQKIVLKDGPGSIEIADSNGNSVKLETAQLTVTAAAKVTINAAQVEVSAGMVQVTAGMTTFSGVVQADTIITNTIIAATYTPGAGNIW
jgi:uncharacterized protein involved in type VI secretion and phage assembly